MNETGSTIMAGRRIRFPDHEYVAGPWTDDELFSHCYDDHGGAPGPSRENNDKAHFAAHEGFEVVRLFVVAKTSTAVEPYLGFGARIEATNVGQYGTEVCIDIPPEHAEWLRDRLASGLMNATREVISA